MDHPYREIQIVVAKNENCSYNILKNFTNEKSRTLGKIVREVALKSSKLNDE